jgi:hypothetical protein
MKSGVLSHSQATRSLHTAASKIQKPLKCAACQYGKQCRRPSPGKTSSVVRDRAGTLKQDDLFAGKKIAVDHFVCSTRGCLFMSKGKTSENEMYCGGCIFVDHATGHLHVEFQKHPSGKGNLQMIKKTLHFLLNFLQISTIFVSFSRAHAGTLQNHSISVQNNTVESSTIFHSNLMLRINWFYEI